MPLRALLILVLASATVPAGAQGVSALVDAQGTLIGEYIEYRSGPVVHSVRGFRFLLNGSGGTVGRIDVDVSGVTYDSGSVRLRYGNVGCAGNTYIGLSGGPPAGGIVVTAGNRGLYYVAKNPTVVSVLIGSVWDGEACANITPGSQNVVPASPNDPGVTGVRNTPYVPPLRLESMPVSQFFQIFRDGFESTLHGARARLDGHA